MCEKAAFLPVFTLEGFDTKNTGCFVTPISRTIKHFEQMSYAHLQDYYSIVFCCNGQIDVLLENVTVNVQSNMVLCMGPGSVMRIELSVQAIGWMIQFSSDYINACLQKLPIESSVCFQKNKYCLQTLFASEMEHWQLHLQMMQQEYQTKENVGKVVLQSYLNILLESLKRKSISLQHVKKQTEKDRKIEVFETLVEARFKELKLPSEFAAAMFVSVNYLNRICQETRRQSSGEIIRQRIVLEAERLLMYTNQTVSEIAAVLGFESLSYFVTFFKRHKDYSPEQYRKQKT